MVVALGDLSATALASALPGRELRTYPALLSTESEAQAWARTGAPDGAIVVAEYQASPRGRGGLPWDVHPSNDLAFSLVLRPDWPHERDGWLYVIATTALAGELGVQATIQWPDVVTVKGERRAAIAVQASLVPAAIEWAVVTAHLRDIDSRVAFLARVVAAVERHYRLPTDDVIVAFRDRCSTLGRHVRARLMPLGPSSEEISGEAVRVNADGALVIDTGDRRLALRPQHVGTVEYD